MLRVNADNVMKGKTLDKKETKEDEKAIRIAKIYSKKKYPTSREQSVIDFWFDVLMCSEDEVFEACRKARCIGATSIDVVDKIIKNE